MANAFVIEGKTPEELLNRVAWNLAEARRARETLRDTDAEIDTIFEHLGPALDPETVRHYMVYVPREDWQALEVEPIGEGFEASLIKLFRPEEVRWPEAPPVAADATTLAFPDADADVTLTEIDEAS